MYSLPGLPLADCAGPNCLVCAGIGSRQATPRLWAAKRSPVRLLPEGPRACQPPNGGIRLKLWDGKGGCGAACDALRGNCGELLSLQRAHPATCGEVRGLWRFALWTSIIVPMRSSNIAYLALGANMGDRLANLRVAIRMLDEHPLCRVTGASSAYETEPVGVLDQPDFLNAVIAVETSLAPLGLLHLCNEVENRLGRERTMRWGPRVIDIDILLYDSQSVRTDELTIPHPRMLGRAFVLAPLAEVAPDVEVSPGITAEEAAMRLRREGIKRVIAEPLVD